MKEEQGDTYVETENSGAGLSSRMDVAQDLSVEVGRSGWRILGDKEVEDNRRKVLWRMGVEMPVSR